MGKAQPFFRITAAAHPDIERRGRFVRMGVGNQQHLQPILKLIREITAIIGWAGDDIRYSWPGEKQK